MRTSFQASVGVSSTVGAAALRHLHLRPCTVLAETFRLFLVGCFICSLFSVPFLLPTPELLTIPPCAAAPFQPSSLGGPGQPQTGVTGNSWDCSRRIITGYARICCIYEIIVENHQSSAGKCLHTAWHCFISFQCPLGV